MPVPSTAPLPAMNQDDAVEASVKTPVLPIDELAPSIAEPSTTPAVSSVPLATGNSQNHFT